MNIIPTLVFLITLSTLGLTAEETTTSNLISTVQKDEVVTMVVPPVTRSEVTSGLYDEISTNPPSSTYEPLVGNIINSVSQVASTFIPPSFRLPTPPPPPSMSPLLSAITESSLKEIVTTELPVDRID